MATRRIGRPQPIGAPVGSTSLVLSKNFIGSYATSYSISDLPVGTYAIYANSYVSQEGDTVLSVIGGNSTEIAFIRIPNATSEFTGVFYNPTQTAATINYAPTDLGWTTRASNIQGTSNIMSLAYGNGIYVGGAYSGNQVITSTDGITWITRTVGVFNGSSIEAAAYGNGVYVLGSNGGWLSTSTDAITWTTRTSNMEDINAAAYGANVYVIAGDSGQLRTSTNAITWTTRTSGFGTSNINAVIYANGLFVASGANGGLRTSTDAITWTARTSRITQGITCLTYGMGLYVAGSTGSHSPSPTNSVILISTDAVTWTTQTSTFGTSDINALAYGGDLFVAAGDAGQIRTSTDAITWTTSDSRFGTSDINALAYGGGLFVAAGDTTELRTNQEGATNVQIYKVLTEQSEAVY